MKILQAFSLSEEKIDIFYTDDNVSQVKIISFVDLTPVEQQMLLDASTVATDRLLDTETFRSVLAQITPDFSLSEERMCIYNNENMNVTIANISSLRKRPAGASEYDTYIMIKDWCTLKIEE